jgi:hypothetical protein
VAIITYALPGKLPLHANTTQIADVRVQEDCSKQLQVLHPLYSWAHMSGLSTLVRPPLSYKRGGMQRYKGTDGRIDSYQAHLDLAQAHKFKQAQYITQWSRVLRSGGPNHSKLLCVLEFIVNLPTGKTLKPPPHLRIRAVAFRHPAGDFPLRHLARQVGGLALGFC